MGPGGEVYTVKRFWQAGVDVKKCKPYIDPVVAAYMRDVDRTLLRENLKLTPAERLEKFVRFSRFAATLKRAGQRAKDRNSG